MPDPKQKIDAFLGAGYYDEWKTMDGDFADESRRFASIRKMLSMPFSDLIADANSYYSMCSNISGDYSKAMGYITTDFPVTKDKVQKLHNLYTLAIGLTESENDVLEAVWGTGFFAAWVLIPFALIQARATETLAAFKNLQAALARAEKETKHAYYKMFCHAAIDIVEYALPEVGLMSRIGFYIADVAADDVFGPSKASTSQKVAGYATPGVKLLSEGIESVEKFKEKFKITRSTASNAATGATLIWDSDEIGEASEAAAKVREATDSAQEKYKELLKIIEDNRSKLNAFFVTLNRAANAVAGAKKVVDATRDILVRDQQSFGYSEGNVTAWLSTP